MQNMLLYHISQIATPQGKSLLRGKDMNHLSLIQDGAIYIQNGIIKLVGTTAEVLLSLSVTEETIPSFSRNNPDTVCMNLEGKTVVPGFVDSHTHFLFGGYRPEEFMMRLQGAAYMDIMKMGGGIQNTVEATHRAPKEQLYLDGAKRLKDMLSMGVTTVEGKSGYGLDLDCELKQLKIMKQLGKDLPLDIAVTFLGAHAVPKNFANHPDEYIDYMIRQVLPVISRENLAEFCDIFCEEGVFDAAQSEKLLSAAKDMGFDIKIHADEILPIGGSQLAARLNAVSADHLLAIPDDAVRMLSESGTAAALLPCTAFCLNKPYAPARKLIDSGCGVALASDYNPGSCFTNHIPLLLSLAVITMGMTMEEALCALTLNGAAAVKRADTIGSIEPGKRADLAVLSYPDYRFLVYHTCKNIVGTVIKNGTVVYTAQE